MTGTSEQQEAMRAAAERMAARMDELDAVPGLAEIRARSYELLAAPDGRIVDVGCGTGRAVAELAERGRTAIGVELSAEAVALAAGRHPGCEFRQGDAGRLPFEDGELAGYRADKVFHLLDHPYLALEEARRVLMPGGRIVLSCPEWYGIVIDSEFPELTATIIAARANQFPDALFTRRTRGYLLDAKFADVTVEARTAVITDGSILPLLENISGIAARSGAVSTEGAEGWLAEQTKRVASDRLFIGLPVYIAAARRP